MAIQEGIRVYDRQLRVWATSPARSGLPGFYAIIGRLYVWPVNEGCISTSTLNSVEYCWKPQEQMVGARIDEPGSR